MRSDTRRLLPATLLAVTCGLALFPSQEAWAQKKRAIKAAPPTREGLLKDVKAAAGFTASIFAMPPDISYPTCLCAAPNGDIYVGIDLNGSLGKRKGQGKIVRCVDTDNDGIADEFHDF